MNRTLLIRNGYLVDPGTGFEGKADLLIKDGVIAGVGEHLETEEADARTIDAEGLTVLPGLVDIHVHLRDPGFTYKEDVGSGTEAAAHGGVTTLLAMPNTMPPMDSTDRISYVLNKAKSLSKVHVHQSSAITKDMKGEELVDIDGLCDFGIKAFSEDGKSVMSSVLMRQAMKRIKAHDALICDHCEDIDLVCGGVMNDDANAARLGLPGISNSVEDVIAARDTILAMETGVRLHLCHCSTEGSVEIVRMAKKKGAEVSAEVCPHHFILTSDDITEDDGNFKMNPPLRSKADRDALIEGLVDGTIECISTDHAPHGAEEKTRGIRKSPFGIVGIESSAALTYTALVKTGKLTLMQMAEKMSLNPARILRVPGGTLAEGSPADVAIFDFNKSYVINPADFRSRGKNTPFAGKEVYGSCQYTISGGEIVWEDRT
ncbi:MAG: dihydroorotase [Lachnospiraceae bacterium]|nr:dihydroorotase [Lachnospiraceae bacterium]